MAAKKKPIKKPVTKKKAAKKALPKKRADKKASPKRKSKSAATEGLATTADVGRPPKYKTPEGMQRIVDLYFVACKVNRTEDADIEAGLLSEYSEEDKGLIKEVEDFVPTVSGLSYALGMSRQALIGYEDKDEFIDTVKRAKQRIEMSLEQRLAGNAVTGSIFNLKNNFGWKDKTEQEISGGLTVSKIERTVVKATDTNS